MPTAKESARSKQTDANAKKKAEDAQAKAEAEAQELAKVPAEPDPPTVQDEIGTGKSEAAQNVFDAMQDGFNVEGEKPVSEPVTETKTNQTSVDQSDQHIFLDSITPGGTQQNNPTPNPPVRGDSFFNPLKPHEVPDGVGVTKKGAFKDGYVYKWDRNDPTLLIEKPEGHEISSAMAVVFVGEDVPEGMFSAYHVDRANSIVWTAPVDVAQDHLHLTLPVNLEETVGHEKVRIVFLDNNGEKILTTNSFTFL